MNEEQAIRERAVQSPHVVRRAVLDALANSTCSCGARAIEVTIDHRSETVVGHCAVHGDSKPKTMSERRLQLSLIEREMRG